MDEIIQQLAEKTGLPIDKAGEVLEAVLGILKDRLPGPIGDQLAGPVSGQGGDNPLGGLLGGIGSLLGGDDKPAG